jgi:predicted amidohydrolase YtcJ
MSADLILTAASVITMEPEMPRAEAVAVDTSASTIVAVGTLADCQSAAPGVSPTDLGDAVLMPGFIDPHNHPVLGGLMTQAPAHWIAPYVGYPTYDDVKALWRKVDAERPAGEPVVFTGLDRLLQGAPEPTNKDLDEFFPSRPAVVMDNSGHEVYFNSVVISDNKWPDGKPPADPVGSSFGRNSDGTSNGRALEVEASLMAVGGVLVAASPNPLVATARWCALMASHGVTATSEHSYKAKLGPAYEALASVPDCPLRLGLYHMSIEPDSGAPLKSSVPASRLWKQGIKLWADGSPWVGTIAASFPYLDSPVVQTAQIPLGPAGEKMMNYDRLSLDKVLSVHASQGWQISFHVNGDVGLDIVLDAYERALATHDLLGTDHRWRVEHVGAARGDQFERAARLGVGISLSPFQFIYWGDLLDGQMFPSEIGGQWMRGGDAFASGAVTTFNNDGPVSPPVPLLNVQCMVTRRTPSGAVHGTAQAVSIDQALRAHTVNAAFQLGRDHDLGSIKAGKLADFVVLSADPYAADVDKLTDEVKVLGTWSGGRKVDTDAFITQVQALDPSPHRHLSQEAAAGKRCC